MLSACGGGGGSSDDTNPSSSSDTNQSSSDGNQSSPDANSPSSDSNSSSPDTNQTPSNPDDSSNPSNPSNPNENDGNDENLDNTAPVLSSTNKTFTTTVGTPLEFVDVTANDDVDGVVDVVKDGEDRVNFNKVGIYTVKYSASDSAGNTSSIKHIYTVKVPVVETSQITHKGITYKIITSPITGRKWLDKNLGAKDACTKSRDDFVSDEKYVDSQKNCFGDLYQWGRYSDGHEKITSQAVSINDINPSKPDTYKGRFITSDNAHNLDWTNIDADGSKRKAFWSKTDGSSICPIGFRVPKISELTAETIRYEGEEDLASGKVKVTDRNTAFKNFLKFPASGARASNDGFSIGNSVWSSSCKASGVSYAIYFNGGNAYSNWFYRAGGRSVRCIKD
ncbi:MAG: hypothetical protein KGV43_00600 [Arcobacter sp.]|nr:hypothetical protein [Arcobacter sp.]